MTTPDEHDDGVVERLRAEYSALPVTGEVRLDELAAGVHRGRRRRVLAVAGAAAAVVLAVAGTALWLGSGGPGGRPGPAATDFAAAASSYDGPLDQPDAPFGAAGLALDCVHPPTGSNNAEAVYSQGATSATPRGAVDTAFSEGLFLSMPRVDLALAASETDRQLLTYEVDGRVLLAVVVHDGPAAEGTGGDGWYVESIARCDFAEFPEAVAEIPGFVRYGIWTDADGVPVPVGRVYSTPGPEHCGWEDMTFLVLDDDRPRLSRSYIEDPDAELRDSVAGPYLSHVPLPDDAVDTGWQRQGRHLWLSPDGRYAYVGTAESVDAWPRFDSGCA